MGKVKSFEDICETRYNNRIINTVRNSTKLQYHELQKKATEGELPTSS
jgi:hypothetical protein